MGFFYVAITYCVPVDSDAKVPCVVFLFPSALVLVLGPVVGIIVEYGVHRRRGKLRAVDNEVVVTALDGLNDTLIPVENDHGAVADPRNK